MAIRNVNGRNVYVLEPRPYQGSFSNGQSVATLYSDLRWQVWEQIQKTELAKLEIEQLSAKARADIYEQSQRDIRRAITNLQELKAEALAGGTTAGQIARAARDQARMDLTAQQENLRSARQEQARVTTVTGKVDPFTGEPLPDVTTTVRREGTLPRITAPRITGAEAQEEATGAGLDFLDQEIARLEAQLQQEQQTYQQALQGTDFDILNRTRRAYESEVGVIGQGGGAFGLAPRSRRVLPRVDQPVAQERIDRLVPAYQAQQEVVKEEQKRLADLQRTRTDIALLITPEEAADRETMSRNEALLASLNDDIAAQQARLDAAMKPLVDLQAEITPRRPGELLLRDRDTRAGFVPPRIAQPATTTGREMEAATGAAAGQEITPFPPIQPPVPPEEDIVLGGKVVPPEINFIPSVDRPFTPVTDVPKPEGEIAPVLPERRLLPELDRTTMATPVPAAIEPPTIPTPRRGEPIALDEEQAITNPEMLRDPSQFVPSDRLLEQAIRYYDGMTIQRTGERTQTIRNPVRYFGSEQETVIQYLQDKVRERAPVGIDQSETLETIREEEPRLRDRFNQGAKSTKQRKDLYKMNVVSEGTKLASQPRRLQRIAKTESEPEDRPQHLVIVDRLYETNKGKANAFRMTYDEISRAFADKPEDRKEAHTYLVAKDILESNIEEPLA